MKNIKFGELELRGERLYLHHNLRGVKVEVDVTPLWHFFKDVQEFSREPVEKTEIL